MEEVRTVDRIARGAPAPFAITPNQPYNSRHPVPVEGRWPSSRTLGRDAVDAAASGAWSCSQGGPWSVSEHNAQTTDANARRSPQGEVGRLRTAKPCGPGARGWRQAGGGLQSPTGPSEPSIRQRRRQDEFVSGERAISRKTIAQGMPECSDCTCMLVCALLRTFAHETAGAASTRHSLRPLFFGRVILQTSGASRRENAESYSVVITREGG
jgi:hypothetical protein